VLLADLADEFYEAAESPPGCDGTATESPVDATNDGSDAAENVCVTDDSDKLTALSESITADSDGSPQLCENAASDVHVADDACTENTAADVGSDTDETVPTECDSVLQVNSSECVNSDTESRLIRDLPADSMQNVLRDGGSQDECAASSPPQHTDSHSSDDVTHSQQLNTADSNVPADDSNAQSETKETLDSDLSQPSDSQLADDANHVQQLDDRSSHNNQETACTLLRLDVVEDPSTADSNDDAAEFVEASTSLNPDDAEELYAETQPTAETQQSDMAGSVEQQQLEDGEVDNKDDEQFVDSSSDISPPQPDEGDVGI